MICAGFHGNEAVASLFVRRDAGGTLLWVATPLVTSSFTQTCIHRTPTYVLTRTRTGFTPHSPNIDIKAITSTTTHSTSAAAIGTDRKVQRHSLSQSHTALSTRRTQMSMGAVTILLGLHTPETPT